MPDHNNSAYVQIIRGIQEIQVHLHEDHFPIRYAAQDRLRWCQSIKEFNILEAPTDSESYLSVAERKVILGNGLLSALSTQLPDVQKKVGQLYFLHEFYHDDQGLLWSNFHNIGRAALALEEIDFAADAFSLELMIMWELQEGGASALRKISEIATRWIDAGLTGIESFDRIGNRQVIEPLFERRLRRYLIWYLQRARAETLRTQESVSVLFNGRPIIELAPVTGALDERSDKFVIHSVPETELVVVFNGQIKRHNPRQGFEPGALVDAIRRFDRPPLQQAMRTLVTENRDLLAPWLTTKSIQPPNNAKSIDNSEKPDGQAITSDDDSGIVGVFNSWRNIRESEASRLKAVAAGDKWYFICISPEGFMPWQAEIEDALILGVEVNFAVLALSAIEKDGRVGKLYAEAICVLGIDNAKKSIESSVMTLNVIRSKAQAREPKALLNVHYSLLPHTSLGFLCVPARRDSGRGWGLVTPYLMHPSTSVDKVHNMGVLFEDNGDNGVYAKYLDSFRHYFALLRKQPKGEQYSVPDA